jgi:hypothetical protein
MSVVVGDGRLGSIAQQPAAGQRDSVGEVQRNVRPTGRGGQVVLGFVLLDRDIPAIRQPTAGLAQHWGCGTLAERPFQDGDHAVMPVSPERVASLADRELGLG